MYIDKNKVEDMNVVSNTMQVINKMNLVYTVSVQRMETYPPPLLTCFFILYTIHPVYGICGVERRYICVCVWVGLGVWVGVNIRGIPTKK